jgi:4'-phosphopantetheinyl transferase
MLQLCRKYDTLALMLTSDSVHVWRIRLDISGESSPTEFEHCLEACRAMLTQQERLRAEVFRFEADRRQYVMTHAVLRILLGGFLHIEPAAVEIVGEGGSKPGLRVGPDRPDLHFNLSHTRGAALIGIAAGREVGIDIEQKRPMEDLHGLARSVMSADELQEWERFAPESRLNTFYRVWTRKEAYLKAIGLGLFRNLQEVTVPMAASARDGDGEDGWRVRDSGSHEVWTVRDIGAWEGYSASVCWAGADAVRVVTHDFDLMGM